MRVFGWLAIVVLLGPLLVAVWVSFSPDPLLHPPLGEWSWRWYLEFFTSRRWMEALGRSLWVAFLTSILDYLLALPLALALVRSRAWYRRWLSALVLSPLGLPPLVLGVGLLPVMHGLGLWGTYLAVVIGHCLLSLPVVYLILRSHLEQSCSDLEQAAQGLGANPWQVFYRITLPLLYPALAAAGMIAFVLSLNEAIVSLFLASPEIENLPRLIWPNLRYTLSPLVAVASTMTILTTLIALLLAQFLLRSSKILWFSNEKAFPGTH